MTYTEKLLRNRTTGTYRKDMLQLKRIELYNEFLPGAREKAKVPANLSKRELLNLHICLEMQRINAGIVEHRSDIYMMNKHSSLSLLYFMLAFAVLTAASFATAFATNSITWTFGVLLVLCLALKAFHYFIFEPVIEVYADAKTAADCTAKCEIIERLLPENFPR